MMSAIFPTIGGTSYRKESSVCDIRILLHRLMYTYCVGGQLRRIDDIKVHLGVHGLTLSRHSWCVAR